MLKQRFTHTNGNLEIFAYSPNRVDKPGLSTAKGAKDAKERMIAEFMIKPAIAYSLSGSVVSHIGKQV
jgi:hypothetical protein